MRDTHPAANPRANGAERRKARALAPADVRSLVIADDDSMFRLGLGEALAQLFPQAQLASVRSQDALQAALRGGAVDLALIDPALPGSNGYLSLLTLVRDHPRTRFVAVSSIDGVLLSRRALALGLAGFVSKRASADRIARVVSRALKQRAPSRIAPAERRLIEGLRRLTPAELTVFMLLPDNPSHRHIMKALDIALPTVKTHMSRILQKLELRNRTEAAIVAKRASVLSTPSLCIERPGPRHEND